MTFLVSSNKDLDFLFYFRSVNFHHVKKTRTLDVSSLLGMVKIVVASHVLIEDLFFVFIATIGAC